jgi:hypothetical protein
MRFSRAAIAAAAVMVGALACLPQTVAAAQRGDTVRGGSGVVSTYGVGSHHFEKATTATITAFAGKPAYVIYWNKREKPSGQRRAVWQIWVYSFRHRARVWYTFHRSHGKWLFTQFESERRAQFVTTRGTHEGMTYSQAHRHERVPYTSGCLASGFWHFRDGQRYAYAAAVSPGRRVHIFVAYGPGRPPC